MKVDRRYYCFGCGCTGDAIDFTAQLFGIGLKDAAHLILEHMNKEAVLHADMCLGEGTGAVALFPILDLAAAVYHSMSTFDDIHVEQYEELK